MLWRLFAAGFFCGHSPGGSPKHIGFGAEDYSSGGARKLHFIRSHGGDIIASADSVSGKRLCKSILTGKIRRVKAL